MYKLYVSPTVAVLFYSRRNFIACSGDVPADNNVDDDFIITATVGGEV